MASPSSEEKDGLFLCLEDTKDFLNAADVIYERMGIDERGFPQDRSFACPYTVLSCYAIESGIKNLLILSKQPFNRGHDLLSLFELLPQPFKQRIISAENVYCNRRAFWERPEEIFRELLGKAKTNFIEARYFFEKKSNIIEICVGFLSSLSHIVFGLLVEESENAH